MTPPPPPGVLYLVATPIGNLEDLTYRAARVLREVDLIACEDTRHSRILLDHYGIRRPTLSYYRENEAARSAEILRRLRGGENVALVSDAGTPLLSDPGARLVAEAVAAGLRVVPLPGPSAALAALTASGILDASGRGGEPVLLLGFFPQRAGLRRRQIQAWAAWPGVLVAFEAPHRLLATLADLAEALGPARRLVLARELTKLHEEFLRGTATELLAVLRERAARSPAAQHDPGGAGLRGEFTLVVAPPPAPAELPHALPPPALSRAELKRRAREAGLDRSELYRRLQQGKIKH
ncbi:MAG: 16S rRNA (cytidine(1402)-2'-O)-methyltransferase [Terriglobales bacterium]